MSSFRTLRAISISLVLSAASLTTAPAAIIGPTMDWKPIRQGAAEFGISDEMIDEILAAGVEISCGEPTDPFFTALNGWFLGKYKDGIFTNAHAVAEDGRLRPNIAECVVRSLRDIESAVAKGGRASDAIAYPIDASAIRARTLEPGEGEARDDRAYVPLPEPVPSMVGLKYRPIPLYRVGSEIFLVSRQNNTLRTQQGETGPLIQRATIRAIASAGGPEPAQIKYDADNFGGDSAAIICIRDQHDPTRLKPIGIHQSAKEDVGEFQDWDEEGNTALGIGLEQAFFLGIVPE